MNKNSNRSRKKEFVFAALAVILLFGGLVGESFGAISWHTFYGSNLEDRALGVATDSSGNLYIVGRSYDTWNGPSGQTPLHAHSSPGTKPDIFILKLASDGSYLWHTFYGGTDGDYGYDVAVTDDNVYVTGFSLDYWEGPAAPKNDPADSYWNIFVLKLTNDGSYVWHTFYGSTVVDEGQSIVLDTDENVYITGISEWTWTGPESDEPINEHTGGGNKDIVILKLNSDGDYQWHTFYGSDSTDEGFAIARDGSNNVFITGRSYASWQGDDSAEPLHAYSGDSGNPEIVVLNLDSDGAYQWHTFYGAATSGEECRGITVDRSGNVYVTGKSRDTWNGPSDELPLHTYAGVDDITVLKLNNSGVYQWHTFYGSSEANDYGLAIGVYGSSNVYVVGRSHANWQGDDSTDPLNNYTGGSDIMILKLNTNGVYQWHTFYGSESDDRGQDLTVDGSGNISFVGYSPATWTAEGNAPLNDYTGGDDIVVFYFESESGISRYSGHPSYWYDCAIATASYGTPMANEVVILKQFRNECLLTNPIGKMFVNTYYKVSPKIAEFISEHLFLKNLTQQALKPIIWISGKIIEENN